MMGRTAVLLIDEVHLWRLRVMTLKLSGPLGALACLLLTGAIAHGAEPISLGSRLELFVDDFLIDQLSGGELRLHPPTPKDVAIVFDEPWEGNTSAYVTVFQDGPLHRMYYRGTNYDRATKTSSDEVTCYAESRDGIHWSKPRLGLFAFEGSKANNIVWAGIGTHNFTPFKDGNPDGAPEARYKALARHDRGLYAFQSSDGIHWSVMRDSPVITKGAFDSQNLAFWDPVRERYVEFHRGFRDGVRDIMTCTSTDFLNWTEPDWIDQGDAPKEHLYTNAITAYFRAPQWFVGFPKRFQPSRQPADHPDPGVSDGVFMTSRDGAHWHRWPEAFIRPGLQPERWVNRNNMTAWGLVLTKSDVAGVPDEISLYSSEGYYVDNCRLRRYTLRQDGFVSVHAPHSGAELITKPLVFDGSRLVINFSTSAVGSVRVEMQDATGKPLAGFTLDDSAEIFGDAIEQTVRWSAGRDVSRLAGVPVRLRFVLHDADLYSLRFAPAEN
jgi:hypothetical protein